MIRPSHFNKGGQIMAVWGTFADFAGARNFLRIACSHSRV